MRWENLGKLMVAVETQFDRMRCAPACAAGRRLVIVGARACARRRWYKEDAAGATTQRQGGVFRSNCMDNLDRTNVVQSLLARRAVVSAALTSPDAVVKAVADPLNSPFREFEKLFKSRACARAARGYALVWPARNPIACLPVFRGAQCGQTTRTRSVCSTAARAR